MRLKTMPSDCAQSGKRGVEQVVRTRPDVDEDERPEVDDGEPVGVDRTSRGFGQVVVHDAEDGRGQEEADGIVPVPPLNQRVLHAGKDGVAVEHPGRKVQVVDDVEDRDGHDGGDVEPERHIQVALVSARHRPEEVDGEDDPGDGDEQIDRPDQLRVFLRLGETERQRNRGADDDELPGPEMEPAQPVRGQPRLEQPLRGVIDAREHHVTDEREDRPVGVQRAQPPEAQPFEVEVRLPEGQLGGHQHSQQQGYDAQTTEAKMNARTTASL